MVRFTTFGLVAGVSGSCHDASHLDVEAMVMSGTENPRMILVGKDKYELCDLLEIATVKPTCRVLGFTGWNVCDLQGCKLVRGDPMLDEKLISSLTGLVTDGVLNHIKEESARLILEEDNCTGADEYVVPHVDCSGPVIGPDDATQVHYDVNNDDMGCFVKEQRNNNCYNYGNDIVTNTFAQPGRGGGACAPGTRPCVPNTCDDVMNGAIKDGLTWVGTELPTELPAKGHYVSLHIWPNSNFHWIRMDANKKWSHKPGGSPVRNYDNNNEEIADPSQADFSPWTQHCGYMLTVPSEVEPTVTVSSSFCTEEEINVETLVFSGTDNPSFTLNDHQKRSFCGLVNENDQAVPTCRVLGFTGWRVCVGTNCRTFRGQKMIDTLFMSALDVSEEVFSHIQEETNRLLTSSDNCHQTEDLAENSDCTAPVVGPDDPALIHFDLQNDNQGCWVTERSKNNCYDYGNDIVTNTFAQPGRGSGVCPPGSHPCVPNTCEDVKNAAVSDGLSWVGTDLPTELPQDGHYVSLHIWPNQNFHWIRMDADQKWSHKPGSTAARNYDNNNEEITDPGQAEFSPWTQHCGYMLSVPSKVVSTLNSPQHPVAV